MDINKILSESFEYEKINILHSNISLFDVLVAAILSLFSPSINFFKKNDKDRIAIIDKYNNRKDYREIFDHCCSRLSDSWNIIDLSSNKKVILFKPKSYNLILNFLKSKGIKGFLLKYYYVFRLVPQINFYFNLKKNKCSAVNKVIFFCSAHPNESILCHYYKISGAVTYSLQHSLYLFDNSKENQANLPFINFPQDFQLVWGEFSKQQFIQQGFASNKIKVMGYPKYFEPISFKKPISGNTKVIVFLANIKNEDQNHIFLKLIYNSKLKKENIYIKLHPSLNYNLYKKKYKKIKFTLASRTITEELSSGDYCLGLCYNSSAYYDAYMQGLRCLRFISEFSLQGPQILNDDFKSVNELNKLLIEIHKNSINSTYVLDKLNYTLGLNINNYARLN